MHKIVTTFNWDELLFIKFQLLLSRKDLFQELISKANSQINHRLHKEVYPNRFD
jgi:hypothetical protein